MPANPVPTATSAQTTSDVDGTYVTPDSQSRVIQPYIDTGWLPNNPTTEDIQRLAKSLYDQGYHGISSSQSELGYLPPDPNEIGTGFHPPAKDPSLDKAAALATRLGVPSVGTKEDIATAIEPKYGSYTNPNKTDQTAAREAVGLQAAPKVNPKLSDEELAQYGQGPLATQEGANPYGPRLDQGGPVEAPREGSYSGSISIQGNPFEKELRQDYGEQLQGMGEEGQARTAAAESGMAQLDQRAQLQRQYAEESRLHAEKLGAEARKHMDEIGALAADYAEDKIDPYKLTKDENWLQKIGTVIGAMSAGWKGGGQGAADYMNGLVDRSIALQQEELHRKGRALYEADNLFNQFLKTSQDEEMAVDKSRAVLLDAAMTDSQKAALQAGIPIQSAQMKQFMASLKMQRDMALAKIHAAVGRGSGTGGPQGWLEIDPSTLVPGLNGQDYIVANKGESDNLQEQLQAYKRIKEGLNQGQELLRQRSATNDPVSYYNLLKQGEALDATMIEATSKLASARGVPQSIIATVRNELPQFGSLTAPMSAAKIPQIHKVLDQWGQAALEQARAMPVEVREGGGSGKKAGTLTYYARRAAITPQAQQSEQKQQFQTLDK